QVLRQFVQRHSPQLHLNSGDRTWYLTMNLTAAPFDDIHVRKAMNWIMDKKSLVQAWGGPTIGKVANHIVPDTLFNNQLAEFAPYKTPDDRAGPRRPRQRRRGRSTARKATGTASATAAR